MTPSEMLAQTNQIGTLFIKVSNDISKYDVVYFYEGIDDIHYYYPIMKRYLLNVKHRGFSCDGKDNVIELYKLVSEGKQFKVPKKLKTLFFVDKDYKNNTDINNDIYITPCYSVENHYFSDNALSNIIIGVLKNQRLTDDDEKDFEKALSYLKDVRQEMINNIIFANAWLSLLVKEKEKHPCMELAVRQVKEYDKIKDIRTVSELDTLAKMVSGITDEQVIKEVNNLKKDPINLLRGKYFEQVFVEPVNNLIEWTTEEKNREEHFFINHKKINFQIGKDSLLLLFANYADVPEKLYKYVEERVN